MSDIASGIIQEEPHQQCDSCGQIKELRPYGPPGKRMICVACATATPEMEALCRDNFYGLMDGAAPDPDRRHGGAH